MPAKSRGDPFSVLGLGRDAGPAAIRAARRRRAKQAHPDHGGDARRMQELNQATVDALAIATTPPEPASADPQAFVAADAPVPRAGSSSVEDMPSFVVEALPAAAFEALMAVGGQIGVIVDDDPPYVLDAVLHAPLRCWCRLEVLPEAGASSVGLLLAGLDGHNPPDLEAVRDAWIAALNEEPALPTA